MASETKTGARYDGLEALCAPVFILLAVFINFLRYHKYPLISPEVFIGGIGIVGVGLFFGFLATIAGRTPLRIFVYIFFLFLVLDLQLDEIYKIRLIDNSLQYISIASNSIALKFLLFFVPGFITLYAIIFITNPIREHLGSIVGTMSLVFLLGAVVLPVNYISFNIYDQGQILEDDENTTSPKNKNILHIILDGHIGVEGIPVDVEGGAELKKKLREFYSNWGFRLYGKIYSPYLFTANSIPAMLNGKYSKADLNDIVQSENSLYYLQLDNNRYFLDAKNSGLEISVIQSEHLNFCSANNIAVDHCWTYPTTSIIALNSSRLNSVTRAKLILGAQTSQSIVVKILHHLLGEWLANTFDSVLTPGRHDLYALHAPQTFKAVERALRSRDSDQLVFAHVLMPHSPYIWESDCQLREPLKSWRDRKFWDENLTSSSTPEFRDSSYQDYFDQVDCTLKLLDDMFRRLKEANLMENLSIVIHGDHGSRITLNDPVIEQIEFLLPQDYIDSFSTHFAIRRKDLNPEYDTELKSTIQMFSEQLLFNGSSESIGLQIRSKKKSKDSPPFISVPMVDF